MQIAKENIDVFQISSYNSTIQLTIVANYRQLITVYFTGICDERGKRNACHF